MARISRQIGWSNESNILYQILNQLSRLAGIITGLKPTYKVYTALLTQTGGGNDVYISNVPLTIGITYFIYDITGGVDFTNVGAPNNNFGTYFVATGTTPNSWGLGQLGYNTGAPVATVLENTIGNIWFTYGNVGAYQANSDGLFTIDKTALFSTVSSDSAYPKYTTLLYSNVNEVSLKQFEPGGTGIDGINQVSIEIRVYN